MRKLSTYIVLVLLLASCGASKKGNSTQVNGNKYIELASEKLGDKVIYKMNESKTYVLCISEIKGTVHQPRNTLSYMVINIKDNDVALEDKIDGGTVKWSGDGEIEVFRTPGIMRDDQTRDDFITLYNIETGKSYPKKNREQH